MKKGEEVIGIVERVAFPNKGMVAVSDNEKTSYVEVKNVIEGQRLRLRITKKRKGRYEGRVLEILAPSSFETEENVCPHFGTCGGCMYASVPYDTELQIKERQIRELLSPIIGDEVYDFIFEGTVGSPLHEEYRNKMEYTFGDLSKDGELMLGHHRRGSFYDILPTVECRLVDDDMRKVHRVTLDFFRERGISYYHKRNHEGYLRHLLIRRAKNTGEILIDLVTSGQFSSEKITEEKLLDEWREALLSEDYEGSIAGILHTVNDRPADVIENQGTTVLYGRDFFTEELLGLSFKVTPFSFFQTNSLGAEVLYSMARKWILEAAGEKNLARVFDLYSGTGTIAQVLSFAAGEVIGVELVEEAVEAARVNAAANGLTNCSFIAGDVLKVLDDMADAPDFIILDPPRDGIHPKALLKILHYDVEHILYISCKATSLARDLPAFFEAGYEVVRLAVVDMFPQTTGVEVVCMLSK